MPDGKFVLSLRCLMLSVELLGTGSHSLPLSKSVPSLEGEAGVQEQSRCPRWNCHRGLSG
jgi:hypothetical protein